MSESWALCELMRDCAPDLTARERAQLVLDKHPELLPTAVNRVRAAVRVWRGVLAMPSVPPPPWAEDADSYRKTPILEWYGTHPVKQIRIRMRRLRERSVDAELALLDMAWYVSLSKIKAAVREAER